MFGLGKGKSSQLLSCWISECGYSLVGLNEKKSVLFYEEHDFAEPSPLLIAKYLTEAVNTHHLVGCPCQVILSPELYQLLLVDAPDVPEHELFKALRWQLKGLIDYPSNDIAVDAFMVPSHGAGERRKKAFAAVTLQSNLINRVSMIKSCLLTIAAISISELALGKLLSLDPMPLVSPAIVISYEQGLCRHNVYHNGDLYLFRTLSMNKTIIQSNTNNSVYDDMLLEIQRSIDYCLMELKLPEPQHIFFTPSFYQVPALFSYLETALNKKVKLLDVNSFFISEPIPPPAIMAKLFYAIGGALMLLDKVDNL